MTLKTFCAAAVSAALLIMLPGCSGPKKTCRKSAKSYFSLLSSNDWTYADSLKLQRMQTDLGTDDSPTFENLTVNGYIDGGLFL